MKKGWKFLTIASLLLSSGYLLISPYIKEQNLQTLQPGIADKIMRFHIMANSDEVQDQNSDEDNKVGSRGNTYLLLNLYTFLKHIKNCRLFLQFWKSQIKQNLLAWLGLAWLNNFPMRCIFCQLLFGKDSYKISCLHPARISAQASTSISETASFICSK